MSASGRRFYPVFSVARCLASARNALRVPPQKAHIVRPEFAGVLVVEFVLPLHLCKTTNRTRFQQTKHMRRAVCLPGRPQVLAVRFSRGEPDRYADWAKAAIDVLTAPDKKQRERLNIIQDDRPSAADVHQWREPLPAGECGFVYLQVRTGQSELKGEHD